MNAAVISGIDASVQARETNLLGYTVTEHYTVFRNHDEQHPAADMVVKTTYRKDVGKNFSIVSAEWIAAAAQNARRGAGNGKEDDRCRPIGPRALITPANYEMTVKGPAVMDGRN